MVRRMGALGAALLMVVGLQQSAQACHTCKATPCVIAPQPQFRCEVDMVPYTVMKCQTRIEYQQVSKTIMVREPIIQWVTQTRTVCRPVYDTTWEERPRTVCRPVYDTQMVNQQYTVCRPVQTTRQVVTTCMQPSSRVVTVPAVVQSKGCGLGLLCGKHRGVPCAGATPAGCVDVVQTCYTPVQVVRDVVETQMVTEVKTRQVPVTTCRMVTEQVVDRIPIRHCRIVQEVQSRQVPRFCGYNCVPKTVTKMVPIYHKEMVPVTKYRAVTRMVPVCPPEVLTATMPTSQSLPASQEAPSAQH